MWRRSHVISISMSTSDRDSYVVKREIAERAVTGGGIILISRPQWEGEGVH